MNIVPLSDHPRSNILPVKDLIADKKYVFKLAQEMEEICRKYYGLGLAATQVGVPYELFVIRYDSKNGFYYRYFCNCRIEPGGPIKKTVEGCLSIPGKQYSLYRWSEPTIIGYELGEKHLSPFNRTIDGLLGTCFQHEIHHCQGVTIDQIGEEIV